MKELNDLNTEQLKAVEYIGGPQMIVAGAGSGKTRVLTYKIAYLIKNGYEPESILALTFTNKAAREMKERIIGLIGEEAKKLWMGTFHSIFARILRVEAKKLNYEPNFCIYDREDSVSQISFLMELFNYTNIEGFTANNVQHRISNLKNRMISAEEYNTRIAQTSIEKKIGEIYLEYTKRLRENNSMDFDDLLLKPIELFNNNPKVLQKYVKQFKYILVDEYQDTNKAQYELIKLINNNRGKVSVVGDDAQSIYGWRGADIQNILGFEGDFPKAKVFKLEQNYRSTKVILQAADSVIKNNPGQIQKTLWTKNVEGELITVIRCSDEKDEALQIAKHIKKEISSRKIGLNDIAILYRINSQSRALEDAFRRTKIPYKIIGGIEFYRRKEVKDLVAYLRVLSNQQDEESLLRIMNFPQRGIGSTSISKMISFSRNLNITLFTTMARVFEVIEVKERIQKNVKQFKILLDKYIELKKKLPLYELIHSLVDELGVLKMFKDENTPESMARYDNVQELLSAVKEYMTENPSATVEDFLAEVSLVSGVDQMNNAENSITLMTVHMAKGLEFPIVFVTGLEEDIFPLNQKFDSDAKAEEERRLFYVALTRAEKKVYLTYARSRYRFGEVAYQEKSRFLREIDPETIMDVNGGPGRKAGNKRKTYFDEFYQEGFDDFDQERRNLRVGSRVSHENFGVGKIQAITGTGEMQKVTVAFEDYGVKQLLVKLANLKLL
jgi:DNA helicase-2/ATP-dependent DNA helicase PcrA